jgi:DNA-binding CsgD family transcriptional regulator
MQQASGDYADLIGKTMRFMGSMLGSHRLAFYLVANERKLVDFTLQNIDHDFHQIYIKEMHSFDPLHISRLSRKGAGQHIYCLRLEEEEQNSGDSDKYRSFINNFKIEDVFEIVFRSRGRIIAGASVIYEKPQPSVPLTYISEAHEFIEANVEKYVRHSPHYMRMTLNERYGLSSREVDVIELICCGRTNSEIADLLQVSLATVKTHLIKIFQKLGVENRASVVAILAGLR